MISRWTGRVHESGVFKLKKFRLTGQLVYGNGVSLQEFGERISACERLDEASSGATEVRLKEALQVSVCASYLRQFSDEDTFGRLCGRELVRP